MSRAARTINAGLKLERKPCTAPEASAIPPDPNTATRTEGITGVQHMVEGIRLTTKA